MNTLRKRILANIPLLIDSNSYHCIQKFWETFQSVEWEYIGKHEGQIGDVPQITR